MSNNNGMDLASGISLGLNGLQTVLNPIMTAHQNRVNLRNSLRIAEFNDKLQRRYAHDAPSIQVQALKDAGVSVGLLNSAGTSPASTNVQASTPQGTAPQLSMIDPLTVSQMMLNRKQSKILDENKRAAAAAADAAETDAQKKAWDFGIQKTTDVLRGMSADSIGTILKPLGATNLGPASEELFNIATGLSGQAFETKMMEMKRQYETDLLAQNVAHIKNSDDRIVKALANMDAETYNNLVRTGQKLLNENNLFKATYLYQIDKAKFEKLILERNYEALGIDIDRAKVAYWLEQVLAPLTKQKAENGVNVDIGTYVSKIKDGDFGIKDAMMMLVSVLATSLSAGASSFGSSIGRIGGK